VGTKASDVQATFCATLVDEWVRRGVRHAVVAPGSRSTPMALALAGRAELGVHIVHDERAAAFVALGLGLDGVPAVLLCTSGTAAANFHPAVVEAGLSDIPLLVLTADRPPELRDVGAPQTIDQAGLYGRAVRWFHDPGVADAAASGTWRSLGRRAVAAAVNGPVHLNLPFREPLLGTAHELPPAPAVTPPLPTVAGTAPATSLDGLAEALRAERGLLLAGGRSGADPEAVAMLSKATGWPVLADPLSGCRDLPGAVTAFDALLRVERFADEHGPDLAVRIGRPAASKVLATWLARSEAPVLQVGGPGVIDPDHNAVVALPASALAALAELAAVAPRSSSWATSWSAASAAAERAIAEALGAEPRLSEPGVARTVAEHLPEGARLVVASSMPVRDLEWYGGPAAVAHANRGANGIDGVLSTALGIALGGSTTVALVGDVAFVHDAGALTALSRRRADLRIVVVDNDGGAIFSFLPQAAELPAARYEQLFGTPHGTDVTALAAAHGIGATTVESAAELAARLVQPGPSVTRVATERGANLADHAALHAAVALAVRGG
jgi:2-succinyl-5-enolpyruvyl-6-hydroxy-3-cyclohexene-1-carboxylate synthase